MPHMTDTRFAEVARHNVMSWTKASRMVSFRKIIWRQRGMTLCGLIDINLRCDDHVCSPHAARKSAEHDYQPIDSRSAKPEQEQRFEPQRI